ncbi:uncharacterized protein LOC114263683 [Camellia sinensis]|uniref:uncharacterized protein LOC114263683 n=1 Tax=Camellia sinensis TaxID=4442 RepID=UPI0010361AAB|nr:uncharacterized protein LOC114263683 [Camellia sinensis]
MEHEETLANMARNTRQGQTIRRTVGGNQGQELGQQEQAAIPNPIGMVQVLQTLAGVVQQQTTIENNLTRLMEQQQRIQLGVGPQPRPRCNITEFKKIALAFDGATDPLEAEKWLTEMEKLFPVFECTDDQKREFSKLEQGNKTVAEYEAEFTKLSKFVSAFEADEDSRARKFERGLRTNIMQQVVPFELPIFGAVLNKALLVESGLTRAQEQKEENYKKRPSSSNFQTNNSSKGNAKRQNTSSVGSWGSRTVGGSVDKQNDRVQCTWCNGFHRDSECRWNTGACFSCEQQGHKIVDCPNRKGHKIEQKTWTNKGASTDKGSSGSQKKNGGFVEKHGWKCVSREIDLCVETPIGGVIVADLICKSRVVSIDNRKLLVDLTVLDMWDFGIILGMDCGVNTPLLVISALQARQLLRNGCEGYLASMRDTRELKLEDILVVKEFPDVFLVELPGLSLDKEIEFAIELIPGTGPISKAPYRMAPAELKELKEQLQELLDKSFIRPSVSP